MKNLWKNINLDEYMINMVEESKKGNHSYLFVRCVVFTVQMLIFLLVLNGNLNYKGCIPDTGTFSDVLGTRRYASDYGLEVGEEKYGILGKWALRKYEDEGTVFLRIWDYGQKTEEIDYLTFLVYDSPRAAKKKYNEAHNDLSEYIEDEGGGWFAARHYEILDATPLRMYYLEDNVIICADIDVCDIELPMPEEEETVSNGSADPIQGFIDRHSLKDYIIQNSHNLRRYALEQILSGTAPEEQP